MRVIARIKIGKYTHEYTKRGGGAGGCEAAARGNYFGPQMCSSRGNKIDWKLGHEKTHSLSATLMTSDTFTFGAIVNISQ